MSTSSVLQRLTEIRDQHGDLYDQLVVDLARSPDHPLHNHFDWDNSIAGEKWRLVQARQLLRVTFRPDPTKPIELRAFVAIKGEDSPRADYMPTDEVLADPFTRKLLLSRMKREATAFARRYSHMAEYAEVVRTHIEGQTA